MKQILIIRFGALGDLCLLAWSISRFAESSEAANHRITLVTKAAFAPLLENVHGVDQVIPLSGSGFSQLRQLAVQLGKIKFDIIIDGHNTLRSNLLLMLMRRRPISRLKKHTTARLALLGLGRSHRHLNKTMSDRFEALFKPLSQAPVDKYPAPLMSLGSTESKLVGAVGSVGTIGLAPGAQWDSKRWPEEYFSELLHIICKNYKTPVRIFLGPKESGWFSQSVLTSVATQYPQVEIIQGRTLVEVASLLADCTQVITNDSGLLHMAESVGTPVLAFFGPTVKQFGYFPRSTQSQVMEIELDCRPCSRNGKRSCHRGDLACLKGISPEAAFQSLVEMSQAAESSP